MPVRHARSLIALCLFVGLVYGCEDDDSKGGSRNRIGPSPISFVPAPQPAVNSIDFFSRGVSLQPAVISPQRVGTPACPNRSPFVLPFAIVTSGSGAELFLNHVDMRFVDRSGVFGGARTVDGRELAELFGSTLIPVGGTRSFRMSLPLGCVGEPIGSLDVTVSMRDRDGRDTKRSLSVPVR
jgi:hypothetical protein